MFDCTVPNNTLSRAELSYDEGTVLNVHYGDVLIKYGSVLDVQKDDIPRIPHRCREDFNGALLQDGDVIIADTAEDETTGKACEIGNLQGSAIVSGLHTMVCRPRNRMALGYLGYYLNSNAYHHQLLPLMQGIKVLSLSRSNIQKTSVSYPIAVKEQQLIAYYFSQLDNLITLHQRQPFLQSPPDISLIVQLTPPFYTFSWEQRELWELTIWDKKFNEVEAEKQPKIIKYPYVLADVFSKIEDASGDVRLLSTGNYIGYTTDEKAGKNLCVGEVVAIPWGGVPNIKYYKGKFVTADNRIATSNDTETLGNRFLSLYLEHSLAFLQSIYRGASIKHPSMNDVLSMQISIPHIQEQREIETWFANLDNLITLHQRQTIVYAVIRSIRKVILAERQYFAPPMVRKSP